MKKYVRYIYEQNQGDRETLKYKLNKLGFYCLNGPDGIFVYVVEDTYDSPLWRAPRMLYNWFLGLSKED